MARRRGSLTKAELKFIDDFKESMSVESIAKQLNRSPDAIKRSIGKLSTMVTSIDVSEGDVNRKRIQNDLRNSNFFAGLKKQFNAIELQYFMEKWVDLMEQFQGDIHASEESELKDLITLEILANRLLVENKALNEQNNPLQLSLNTEYGLDEGMRDEKKINRLRASIAGNQDRVDKNLRSYKDLIDRSEKTRKSMNASREQRTKDLTNSKINFTHYLKLLQEYHQRVETGREMEIMKMAKDKAQQNMQVPIKYKDGNVDIPVLNEESAATISEE